MSRNINAKASITITDEEKKARETDRGKLLFTGYRGQTCALLLQNDRLKEAMFLKEAENRLGAVYVGKIKNVAKNINACFVEIAGGEICFLSMKNAAAPCLLNRTFDGRLLEGDELLVQVEREAQKTKQASVTAHISLSNDYFAIQMGSRQVGYSAKLDSQTRKRIQYLLTEMALIQGEELIQDVRALLSGAEYDRMIAEGIQPDYLQLPPTGCIVRTRAAAAEAGELLRHFFELTVSYVRLLCAAAHRSCFSCLKEAPSALETVLEQFAAEEYQEIVTDSEELYRSIQEYGNRIQKNGGEIKPLRLYQDQLLTLSGLYSIESRLEEALARRVWLKSGAYLVIDHTEAMTVIDVNSGKYEKGRGAEDAYLKVNLEAAEEIARQLRLRNLSGIIIVDFINMKTESDRQLLFTTLKAFLKRDKIKTMAVDMTPLGLVEITRKKINRPLSEQIRCAGNLR